MRASVRTPLLLAALFGLVSIGRADDGRPLTRIAFGSCAHQDKPQPIWDAVVAARPELFLFLGDTVYADTDDMAKMRATYQKLADNPGWQKVLRTCPVMATWDDHEYGKNDAGADYPKKTESQRIFLDFFQVPPDSPRRKQEGIYEAKVFGPPGKRVQVILLDTRYHRSPLRKKPRYLPWEGPYLPDSDPKKTFLGEAQWRWLEEQLKQPAELRLLGSSIQVVPEDHAYEKWMNLPLERERLFRLIQRTKAAGVVILSGDRHLAELSMMDAGIGYPLYDLTSSGLNQAFRYWRRLEVNRHRVATMNQGNNFGLLTIDWEKSDPRISLQVRDEEGEIAFQQKLTLNVLRPGTLVSGPAALPKLDTGEPLTAAEVKARVGKPVTLLFVVRSTGTAQGRVFLNSADDHRSDDNFTVVLERSAVEALRKSGVTSPQEHFKGKMIQVSGTLSLFREKPQVLVSETKQVVLVEKSDESP